MASGTHHRACAASVSQCGSPFTGEVGRTELQRGGHPEIYAFCGAMASQLAALLVFLKSGPQELLRNGSSDGAALATPLGLRLPLSLLYLPLQRQHGLAGQTASFVRRCLLPAGRQSQLLTAL